MKTRSKVVVRLFWALVCIGVTAFAQEKFNLKLTLGKADGNYNVGETANVKLLLEKDGQPFANARMQYVLNWEQGTPVKGEVEQGGDGGLVSFKFDKPNRAQLDVSVLDKEGKALQNADGKPISASIGAVAGLETYRPHLEEPADFMEFWQNTIAELKKVPIEVLKMEPVPEASLRKNQRIFNVFDIRIRSLGDIPVSGYLAVPKNAVPGKHPAMLTVPGAGPSGAYLNNLKTSRNFICLDIGVHGLDNDREKAYYANAKKKISVTRGIEAKETLYFRNMFMRVLRALEYLKSRPEWDGKTLVVQGWSQGGFLATMSAALDPQVSMIMSGITAGCDFGRPLYGLPNSWPSPITVKDGKPAKPKAAETARYYDGCFFARRIKCEAYYAIGLLDKSCTATYTAYNQIQAKKSIRLHPTLGHSHSCVNPDFVQRMQTLSKEAEKAIILH